MAWHDYRCDSCRSVEAWNTQGADVIELHCPYCDDFTYWKRVWSAPRLGSMSSGRTPPR